MSGLGGRGLEGGGRMFFRTGGMFETGGTGDVVGVDGTGGTGGVVGIDGTGGTSWLRLPNEKVKDLAR